MLNDVLAVISLSDIVGYLWSAWYILLVLIGFSIIIFVHELGHFLMAKLVGIKVDTFAIGFGPRLLGYKTEETDYCLRLLPLGGYVKMLGQEDFALDQDRVDATKVDPRSFLAKTPGQRMLVVSGGVVMNVIFAAIGFVIVFMSGLEFGAPIAGMVLPNSPAQEAGIEPGDRFVSINGEPILHFNELKLAIALSDPKQSMDLVVERNGKTLTKKVRPLQGADLLQIGVGSAGSLKVWDPGITKSTESNLKKSDVILKADSFKPEYYHDLDDYILKKAGKPVELTVERMVDKKKEIVKVHKRAHLLLLSELDRKGVTPTDEARALAEAKISILGFVPRRQFLSDPEREKKDDNSTELVIGGDVIVKAGNISNPTKQEIREYLSNFGGKEAKLTVLRQVEKKEVGIYVPLRENPFGFMLDQMGFDDIHPIVSSVLKNTPADILKIPRGSKILSCNDKPVENWFDVIETLKANTGKDVKLSWDYEGRTSSGTLSVPKDSAWQSDVSYAMDFVTYPLNTVVKGKNPVAAFVLGIHQTWYLIKSTYVMLQRVAITQTVGVKNLSGPIYIINQGREVAEAGFNKLLYYLAMISANIAVINFLPIPVVDGGLMIILILEKIRGRSMSPRSTAVWQTVGLSLIVCLFLFVTYNDIARLIRGQ